MAAAAALPGFIDWAVGIPSGTAAKSHDLTNMLLNVTALVIFIIGAVIHTGNWKNPSGEGSGIVLALIGVLCTVGAGYFGWTMIQTNHVGVQLSPEQERLDRNLRTTCLGSELRLHQKGSRRPSEQRLPKCSIPHEPLECTSHSRVPGHEHGITC